MITTTAIPPPFGREVPPARMPDSSVRTGYPIGVLARSSQSATSVRTPTPVPPAGV